MTRLLKDSLGGNCRTVMTLGIFLTQFLTKLLTFISTFHFMLWSLLRTEARRVLQPHTSAGTEH